MSEARRLRGRGHMVVGGTPHSTSGGHGGKRRWHAMTRGSDAACSWLPRSRSTFGVVWLLA